MKIGLINGSPKALGSTSEVLLDELKAQLPENHDLISIGIHHAMLGTKRAHLKWGQGIGIGTGIMIAEAKDVPMGHALKKNLAHPYSTFVNNLLDRESADNLYVNPTYPRFALLQGANHDWTKQGKAHGLRKKDLTTAP